MPIFEVIGDMHCTGTRNLWKLRSDLQYEVWIVAKGSAVDTIVLDTQKMGADQWHQLFQTRIDSGKTIYVTNQSCEQLAKQFARLMYTQAVQALHKKKAVLEVGVRIHDPEQKSQIEFIWKR